MPLPSEISTRYHDVVQAKPYQYDYPTFTQWERNFNEMEPLYRSGEGFVKDLVNEYYTPTKWSGDYKEMIIPTNSLIYCDPPYKGSRPYIGENKIIHSEFWDWCREKVNEGHIVFVSEYDAPTDFECIWSQEVKSSLSANGKIGGNKISIEKLFKYKEER